MYQPKPDLVGKPWPTMYDLPSDYPEDSGLPDEFHLYQPQVLSQTCQVPTYDSEQVFIASDLNIYYNIDHLNWYKRPDWFVAVGGTRAYENKYMRQSFVVWDEPVTPLVVVELISEGTEAEDLGKTIRKIGEPPTKWEVYEQILKVPYYATFDERDSSFRKFILQNGRYQELDHQKAKFWIEELQLGLGIWHGFQIKWTLDWLRWYDAEGNWLPTEAEQTKIERQRAEQERQRAEQESQKVEMLKAQLRSLGIEPNI